MTRARGIAAALLGAVFVSVGCSSSKPDDNSGGAARGGSATGGSATGGSASGGKASGGRSTGGSAGHAVGGDAAGSSADAGTTQHGGTGGSDDAGAQGGAGGVPVEDPCAVCPSGLCLPSGECVACLLGNDQCPAGQYCSGATNTCVPGCKDAASCASGVCAEGHDCQNCISDGECSEGKVCSDGQCAPPCTEAEQGGNAGCGAGLTCCALHCIDDRTDSAHCGAACGAACGATSFCAAASCEPTLVASLCTIAKVVVVLDGQDGDQAPARALGAALAAQCAPTPTVREIDQGSLDVTGVANPSSGQPVAGGAELLVVAGGYYFAHVANYSENGSVVAPIYAHSDGSTGEYRSRADGAVVASFSMTEDPSHYVFVVQFMRDPISGSLILNTQGFWQNATALAARYFTEQMLPALATFTQSWYVYDWTDENHDQIADPAEITLVQSGP